MENGIESNVQENVTTNENLANEATENQTQERLFTQDEVNKIVTERLKRDREKRKADSDLPHMASEAELLARANRLDCREFIIEHGYPSELLDVVDTNDVDAFKEKVANLNEIYKSNYGYPRVKDGGEVAHHDDENDVRMSIRKGFQKDAVHVPKKPKNYF